MAAVVVDAQMLAEARVVVMLGVKFREKSNCLAGIFQQAKRFGFEAEVQLALGQVSKSESQDYGNRTVTYDDQGHPVDVTFVNGKATTVKVTS